MFYNILIFKFDKYSNQTIIWFVYLLILFLDIENNKNWISIKELISFRQKTDKI
jgi:hypothetical protein